MSTQLKTNLTSVTKNRADKVNSWQVTAGVQSACVLPGGSIEAFQLQTHSQSLSLLFSQNAIHSHIRLFEPLVIKALKQYTTTTSVRLQRQVLDLLAQLVQLRVNYCLLDSDQVGRAPPLRPCVT